ncbi:MAG: hypothetical protein LBT86_07850 [Deltaproteobacteria bacterium]|nr:hypothetical protein [Deltaproteobacteria bacterium]
MTLNLSEKFGNKYLSEALSSGLLKQIGQNKITTIDDYIKKIELINLCINILVASQPEIAVDLFKNPKLLKKGFFRDLFLFLSILYIFQAKKI